MSDKKENVLIPGIVFDYKSEFKSVRNLEINDEEETDLAKDAAINPEYKSPLSKDE